MNLKTLKNMYSNVDWIKLINNFVIRTQTTPSITENTMLKFLQKDSLQKLMALLQSTKPRVVANLVALDVLANGIQAILPNQASLLSFTSFPAEAIIRNQAYFGRFLASLFVQKTFDKSIRSKVQDLVDLSIKEMKLLLAEVKWMDNSTK